MDELLKHLNSEILKLYSKKKDVSELLDILLELKYGKENEKIHYLNDCKKYYNSKKIDQIKKDLNLIDVKIIGAGYRHYYPLDVKNLQIKVWEKYSASNEEISKKLCSWTGKKNVQDILRVLSGDFLEGYRNFLIYQWTKQKTFLNKSYFMSFLNLKEIKPFNEILDDCIKINKSFQEIKDLIYGKKVKKVKKVKKEDKVKKVKKGDKVKKGSGYTKIKTLIIKWVKNEKKYEKEIEEMLENFKKAEIVAKKIFTEIGLV